MLILNFPAAAKKSGGGGRSNFLRHCEADDHQLKQSLIDRHGLDELGLAMTTLEVFIYEL